MEKSSTGWKRSATISIAAENIAARPCGINREFLLPPESV
jgi:hypothetical protein